MAATDQQLHVFLNETPMGMLRRATAGKLSFIYEQAYLENEAAVPLSLTMPLDDCRYSHEKVNPWLWGLLPDNELILARWAQRFQVSPSNAFGLLQGMGEDCRFAMKIGGYYKDAQIQPQHFMKMARNCEFAPQEMIDMMTEMAGKIPKAAKAVKAELDEQGIRHAVLGRLVKGIRQRAATTLKDFADA